MNLSPVYLLLLSYIDSTVDARIGNINIDRETIARQSIAKKSSSKKWRIMTTVDDTKSPDGFDGNELDFYDTVNCSGNRLNAGTPISSNYYDRPI